MRYPRLLLAAAVALLFATSALAQTPSLTITPNQFYLFSAEETMDLQTDSVFGSDHNDLVFSGPDNFTFTIDGSSSNLLADVSVPNTYLLGTWSLTVNAFDTPAGPPRAIGPATITIVERPQTDPPILNIPDGITVAATSTSGAIATFSVSAINDDGSPVPVTCDHNSGDLFPLGATDVHCSATNSFGTTLGTFPVFVSDLTAPVLHLPANIVTASTTVTYTVTATDDLDPSPTVFCSPASGSTFAPGVTTVQCTAVDNFANSSVGTFTVTVVTSPPTLTLPSDITAEATSSAGAVVTYTATADEDASVVCNPASGSTFPLGTTTVNCSATNVLNQTTTGSFHVNVVDTTPPTLALPSDITAEATSPSGAVVTFNATATDLVDGSVLVHCTPASGSTFPLGTTSVQCSATDLHNNTATGSFNVTVQDTTPPTITSLTANPATLWPDDHKMINVTITGTATDLVDTNPTLQIISVTSDQPVVTNSNGDQSPDWVITGAMTLQLREERVNGVDRTYTITVAATDFSGNTSTSTVQVQVTQSSGNHRAVSH
ncbi:MAG TPA: HYR domain-containing protein [Thermoanaerobaculia bacterium]|nr:HYR domain-containing protein [Thermoanaerobaculia bacterium]